MIIVFWLFVAILIGFLIAGLRRPGVAMALLILILPIKYALEVGLPIFSDHVWWGNALCAIVAGVCYVRIISDKAYLKGYRDPVRGWLVFFIALVPLSLMWSTFFGDGPASLEYYIEYVPLLVLLLPLLLTREDDFKQMMTVYLWLGTAAMVVLTYNTAWQGRGAVLAGRGMYFDVGSQTWSYIEADPLTAATLGTYIALTCILLNAKCLGKVLAILRWPLVILSVYVILRSSTRGQTVTLAVAAFCCFPLARRFKNPRAVVGAMISIAILGAILYFAAGYISTDSHWDTTVMSRDLDVRIQLAINSFHYWTTDGIFAFLLGHGYNSSFDPRYGLGWPEVAPAAVVMDFGLLGITVWFWLLYASTRTLIRMYRMVREDDLQRPYVVLLGAFLATEFALSLKESNYFVVLMWCFVISRYAYAMRQRLGAAELEIEPIFMDGEEPQHGIPQGALAWPAGSPGS